MRGAQLKSTRRARALRRRSTRAEWVLWLALRDRRLGGLKFTRQQPIGPYCVDFICREQRLVIEVDGGQHADSASDQRRDTHLNSLGYRVIRVWNNEVLGNLDGVLQMLESELGPPLTLSLSPQAGRGNATEMPNKQDKPLSRLRRC